MSKKTFQDVRNILESMNYKIEKDPAFTVRRYLLTTPKKEIIPIRYIPTMDELYTELHRIGVEKFIDKHKAEARTTSLESNAVGSRKIGKSLKASKTKSVEELKIVPKGLKNKRSNNTTEKYDEEIVTAEVNEFLVVSGQKTEIKKINFNVKIPKTYEGYHFPNNIENIINRLKLSRPIMLTGPAGCGKSELPQFLGKLMKTEVVRINFNVGTTEQHLIGKFVVKDNHTKFIYGLVPLAMKNGWFLVLDEIDYAQPEHLSALQAMLEGAPLVITQNENEKIYPHDNFRVFATGNTKGRGDESQSYVGTNFLNMAFLDRWSIFEMEYTSAENKICEEIINDATFSSLLVDYFKILRKTAKDGEFGNVSFSTRRLIQICEVIALGGGGTFKEALEYELFSRYDDYEVNIMRETSYDIWDRTHYFAGKGWKLGDAHFIKTETIDSTANINAGDNS